MGAADPAAYTVRAVAERLGIPTATLRSWNQRYGIGPRAHEPGQHRLYTAEDVRTAARMVEMVRAGASPAGAARAVLTAPRPPVPDDPAAVLEAALGLDSDAVGALLHAHLDAHGVVATWERLCRPVFAEVMTLQSGGHGCIDVEHVLSWATASSLHRHSAESAVEPRVLLACTSGEGHTLALEALRAAVAERGIGARMLGASVPNSALRDAVRRGSPEVVVLWAQRRETARVSAVRAASATGVVVLISGPGWGATSPEPPARSVHDLAGAVDLVGRLLTEAGPATARSGSAP
ncbi:MerR family transcriptional regulator [Rhodococcus sp. D2-41]|uniref:MerR family transcriptional regulator n=1 Tax=Speluncibacter jeojiensis TaxID=2710754 RepID=A0A9X4RCR7_9ACTN|nr:MerR family transcriptional regulator [Rhodococcus sp. D2-41]MDG3010832.1 MerR family transcriptional regulator [Rhodococcus sp. D2-41]MDG3013804.1 MerR family transcriptional regulator [Corynebacteriales bacterium D3-21]